MKRSSPRPLGTCLLASLVSFAGLPAAADTDTDAALPEIVVTSTLRATPAIDVPASVTVLGAQTLSDAGRTNFEDVLGLIPNLNRHGDTSLPRYFQLRGNGELEQLQGAPNPSVGFLIDDIDFSGLGTAGTLYDLAQVEVLRGHQATRYGANALAVPPRRPALLHQRLLPRPVGTFGAMYLLNYTLDNSSLMALTVATGFVVDDAIVVMENATRHIEAGMGRVSAVGPQLAETLFDGGLRRTEVAQARAAYEASVATYRQTVLSSRLQASVSLIEALGGGWTTEELTP